MRRRYRLVVQRLIGIVGRVFLFLFSFFFLSLSDLVDSVVSPVHSWLAEFPLHLPPSTCNRHVFHIIPIISCFRHQF